MPGGLPEQHGEQLRGIPLGATEVARPGVSAFHVGSGIPLGGNQRRTQDGLQG